MIYSNFINFKGKSMDNGHGHADKQMDSSFIYIYVCIYRHRVVKKLQYFKKFFQYFDAKR